MTEAARHSMQAETARADYAVMLRDMGVSPAVMSAMVSGETTPLPPETWNYRIAPSEIEGSGGFAVRWARAGDILAPARREGVRTEAGRYTNHAVPPNARLRANGDDLDLVAVGGIAPGDEITIDYRAVFTERGVDWRTHVNALTTGDIGALLMELHGGRSPKAVRAAIAALAQQMLKLPASHVQMRVEHEVAHGMYRRTLFIPRDTLVMGKVHLQPCMNIVARGSITVLTEFGARRLGAGFCGASSAGIQKVGWAHEDTVFVNVFRTDLTDIPAIESSIAEDMTLESMTCL